MYSFTPTTMEQCRDLFRGYISSITGINDDFWEEHVSDSRIYRIEMDKRVIGITGIYKNDNMTFFHITPDEMKYAQDAFAAALDILQPKYAFAPTNDEAFLSLCMDRNTRIDKQAYFFRYRGANVRQPEFGRELLSLATPSDASDILDSEGVEENIRLGKYYVMRKDGVFLGQGFFNLNALLPEVASIGMSVHPDHRQKGVGRSIIMHLADICREQGITPCCGCWYYNHNSKRTLESAGFITQTRLLKIWFIEQEEKH